MNNYEQWLVINVYIVYVRLHPKCFYIHCHIHLSQQPYEGIISSVIFVVEETEAQKGW